MAKTSDEKNKNTGRHRFVKCLLPMILSAIVVGGGFYSFYRVEMEEYKTQNAKLQEKLNVFKGKTDMLLDEISYLEDSIICLNHKIDSMRVKDSVLIEKIRKENEKYRQKLDRLNDFNSAEHFKFFTRYLDSVSIRGE
jgi:predicted nuclease with TOPRIM domain